MTKSEFEAYLRQYLQHQPFHPFTVQLKDGRRVLVSRLPVVFSDGAASFIDPTDGALVDFAHDDVLTFGPLQQEVPA